MRLLIPRYDTKFKVIKDFHYDVSLINNSWQTNFFKRNLGNIIYIPANTIIVIKIQSIRDDNGKLFIRNEDNKHTPKEICGVNFRISFEDIESIELEPV